LGPKHLVSINDLIDGSLSMSHGDAFSFANVRVMGMEFPTLIDEIVIVSTVISNEVTILVGWIVHAGRAVHVLFIDSVERGEGVFLGFVPPCVEIFGFAIALIFGP
jgi:hypothetical protein